MKKATIVMLSVLLIFIGLIAGLLIGRRSANDSIIISYQDGHNAADSSARDQLQESAATIAATDLGRVNINTASLTQLSTLTNIGEVLAQRIIDYRTEHGPFQSVDELLLVKGIGITRLEEIRDEITIGG